MYSATAVANQRFQLTSSMGGSANLSGGNFFMDVRQQV